MDFDEIADELYGLPPEEFTAARDERAAAAREASDRELATRIGKLRRPTQAAWLANLLTRNRGAELDGLLGLAASLRDAQRSLDGETLRALSTQRHQLVNAMSRQARALARAAGHPVADGVERELSDILEAALADPQAAEEVRSGRLTKTLRYSGFGPAAPEGPPPRPAPHPEPAGDEDAATPDPRIAQAERNLASAEADADKARERRDTDETAAQQAEASLEQARGRVTELTEQLEAARRAESETARRAREARQAQRTSARNAQSAQTRLQQARARLEQLQTGE